MSARDFKAGDVVVVKPDHETHRGCPRLSIGEQYTVVRVEYAGCLRVRNAAGDEGEWFSHRFELAPGVIQKGDRLRCIESGGGVMEGGIYYALQGGAGLDEHDNQRTIEVSDNPDGQRVASAFSRRFELAPEPRTPTLPTTVYVFRDEDGDLWAKESLDAVGDGALVGIYQLKSHGTAEAKTTVTLKAA